MSLESVRAFFAEKAPDIEVIELPVATATVALAAEAHGVEPGRIAKTLSLRVGQCNLLVVARGDARLDNRKLKALFGGKAKMLDPESVLALTGHPVGGVCPFGLVEIGQDRLDSSRKSSRDQVRAAPGNWSPVSLDKHGSKRYRQV